MANVYAEPAFHSAVTTQCILGEKVIIQNKDGDWLRITQWDDYSGWIQEFYLVDYPEDWAPDYSYRAPLGWIFNATSRSAKTLRQITAGSRLPGVPENNGWVQVSLPDGTRGFVPHTDYKWQSNDIRSKILETAERFFGTSYLWGGKTGFGFDCSGFVQTVFRLNGINLRRDTWMQMEQGTDLDSREDLRPGDLVFFAEKEKVSHVGIAYNESEFIHCSGYVRRNSFEKEASDYSARLDAMFIGAQRIIQE